MTDAQKNRGTIFMENASVVAIEKFPGAQFVMRLHAPRCAARATPGSFAHIQCDDALPMRRPLSIMRTDAGEGWIEILFKIVGDGLRLLGSKEPGDIVSVIGPIGHGFSPDPARPRTLLIGGGVGIPPVVFLADSLRGGKEGWQPLVIMGSEIPFPFETVTSKLETPWLPIEVNQTMPLLESWNVPARLASLQGYSGCFNGYVTDLANRWLHSLSKEALRQVEIFSCGPTPMLQAVASLARTNNLPCQVSLEEFMACGVGGCAGCTVQVDNGSGPEMKRVCVDGPVFDASTVFLEKT